MSDPIESAERLARLHPGAALPCPRCGAGVKGANLERHLVKVHSGADSSAPSAGLSWRGPERLIARPLIILPLLGVAGTVGWVWRSGTAQDVVVFTAAGAVGLGLILYGLVLKGVPLFRGRLTVRENGLVLSHTLGLRHRRLDRVDRIEVGSAYSVDSIGSASDGSGGMRIEEQAGVYLEFHGGRGNIIVRCNQSTGFRKHWTGWEPGKRSRHWHITLDPADFVALQYALSDMGLLSLRIREAPA